MGKDRKGVAVTKQREWIGARFREKLILGLLVSLSLTFGSPLIEVYASINQKEQLIPILGITMDKKHAGTMAFLVLTFEDRQDQGGLAVHFRTTPGRFSPMAQTSVEQAIRRAAQSLHLSTDSWTVTLSVPYVGLTVYGDSLSAMVGLSVIALAQGKVVPSDRVITGTITPEGHIGRVGSVSLKVSAAHGTQLNRVIVPDEQDPTDRDWQTPFLMHVYPVESVFKAYNALTEDDSRP